MLNLIVAEKISQNVDAVDEQLIYSWTSPERVFRGANKELYSTVIVLATLVSVILFFIEGFMPVMVVWAIVFVFWTLSKTPPTSSSHQITSWGIRTGNNLYRYQTMKIFWFETQESHRLLHILTTGFPGQLIMIIDPKDEAMFKQVLHDAGVYYEIPKPNILDKTLSWFESRMISK